jgi:hypothetical protein
MQEAIAFHLEGLAAEVADLEVSRLRPLPAEIDLFLAKHGVIVGRRRGNDSNERHLGWNHCKLLVKSHGSKDLRRIELPAANVPTRI